MELVILILWVWLGFEGALIQRSWYKRRGYKQHDVILDFIIGVMLGPIGLIASFVAYGS